LTLDRIVKRSDFEKLSASITELGCEFSLYKEFLHFTKKGIILEAFSEKQDLKLVMKINVNSVSTRIKGNDY